MTLPPKSTNPLPVKYNRSPFTEEEAQFIEQHSKWTPQAIYKQSGIATSKVVKYRQMKKIIEQTKAA